MTYRREVLNRAYRNVLAAQQAGSHALYCVTLLGSPLLAAEAARKAAHLANLALGSLTTDERAILFCSI
jgi:hypothetical protein